MYYNNTFSYMCYLSPSHDNVCAHRFYVLQSCFSALFLLDPTPHIVVTLLLFLVVAALRFGYFETLFNPVLSDSFGFDERDSSYYFLALAVPYLGGVLTL